MRVMQFLVSIITEIITEGDYSRDSGSPFFCFSTFKALPLIPPFECVEVLSRVGHTGPTLDFSTLYGSFWLHIPSFEVIHPHRVHPRLNA